jgi:hypothetical protein
MIDATPEKLMQQAPSTVEFYLDRVIEMLDQKFGSEFSSKNPKFVSDCVKACAIDFCTAIICKTFEEGVSELVEILHERIENSVANK